MRLWFKGIVSCVLALGLTLSVVCAANSDVEAAAELRERIAAMTTSARCNNIVNCRVIGLGARPCGGPEEYIAYSIWDTKIDEIGSLAAEYEFLKEEISIDAGEVGSCEVLPKPDVNCVHARCVLVR
jgi:hypothetical protein